MIDVIPSRQRARTIGGGGPQSAAGSSLGNGHTHLIAVVGTDVLQDETLAMQLRATGADMSKLIIRPDITTPRYIITYDKNERPAFYEDAGFEFWETILETDMIPDSLTERDTVDILHVLVEEGGHSELHSALKLRHTRFPHAILSFEPIIIHDSPQHRYDLIPRYLTHAHITSPDLHTALRVTHLPMVTQPDSKLLHSLREKWLSFGPLIVVVRNGASGSYAFTKLDPENVYHIPVLPDIQVADVTGAGNAFAAAFSTALVATQGTQPEQWNVKGILWAAAVATVVGGRVVETEGLPVVTPRFRRDVWKNATHVVSRIREIPALGDCRSVETHSAPHPSN